MSRMKLYTIIAMAALATTSAAQSITGRFEFGYADRAALSVPKEFSYGSVPYLVLVDNNDQNNIQVYDENLDVVKTIAMKESMPFNYQLTCQAETREVTAVNETYKNSYCSYESYEAFIQRESLVDPYFNESCLIIKDFGDGTRKITVDYTNSGYTTNRQMYFAYDYFGMQYPKVYFIENSEGLTGYRVEYAVEYSEWQATGTTVNDYSADQDRIRLCNINLNNGDGRANSYFEVSQTLFTSDEGFEYILPKYKLSANGNVGGSYVINGGGDTEQITTQRSVVISEQKELALAGFQVLSEDGNGVSDITFDGDFEGSIDLDCAFVITIGNTTYLAFDGYSNGQSSTIFYKIDRSTSSIQKVKTAPSTMKLTPTVVNSGSTINVNFGDDNVKGSDLVVVSASGAAVQTYHVPAGQTSAQIQANTSAGMYCISRLQKNKAAETKKIIVK